MPTKIPLVKLCGAIAVALAGLTVWQQRQRRFDARPPLAVPSVRSASEQTMRLPPDFARKFEQQERSPSPQTRAERRTSADEAGAKPTLVPATFSTVSPALTGTTRSTSPQPSDEVPPTVSPGVETASGISSPQLSVEEMVPPTDSPPLARASRSSLAPQSSVEVMVPPTVSPGVETASGISSPQPSAEVTALPTESPVLAETARSSISPQPSAEVMALPTESPVLAETTRSSLFPQPSAEVMALPTDSPALTGASGSSLAPQPSVEEMVLPTDSPALAETARSSVAREPSVEVIVTATIPPHRNRNNVTRSAEAGGQGQFVSTGEAFAVEDSPRFVLHRVSFSAAADGAIGKPVSSSRTNLAPPVRSIQIDPQGQPCCTLPH